jgi:hypothetical protein
MPPKNKKNKNKQAAAAASQQPASSGLEDSASSDKRIEGAVAAQGEEEFEDSTIGAASTPTQP